MKILFLDDNKDMIAVMDTIFKHHFPDVEFHATSDENSAKDYLEVARPDIAILDVFLKKETGYEIAQFIRQELKNKEMYIILYTGKTEAIDSRKAREVGVNILIPKGNTERLITEIKLRRIWKVA